MDSIKELFEYEDISNKSPLLKWTTSISNSSKESKNDDNKQFNDTTPASRLSIRISPLINLQ